MTASSTLPRRLDPPPPTRMTLPRPGDRISIAEHDYLGGDRRFTGTVVEVDTGMSPLQLKCLEWVHLVVAPTDPPHTTRTLIVRVAALGVADHRDEFITGAGTYTGDHSRQPIRRARTLADLSTSTLLT
ncbi:hypothetical protein [Polymorphospora rubra]|uniref:hypothetical protein n=1 Tax=Polymorphospora rubra TaxID=338584 RepID=UPI0033EE7F26